ncbi:hypothetical protein IW261DRAFT_144657 [Armillaria novae-zelandiae]|uniref:DUF6699 domain-containing protein n=1 Tax=Armillaria novae-zelandiae TaxID=153914 RepID=A0AA39P947_9AGAR|nr:hypothetical protein IW261DRAFT_144657 [Armillaria novae-zelandiae]
MNDAGTKRMSVQREDMATMMTQQGREAQELHLSPATAFSTPSRASIVMPIYGDAQLTTTVPVCRRCISEPNASCMGYVAPLSPPALGKPRHRSIPLPPQTENNTPMRIHPLLRPSHSSMMMELDFTRSLSSIRILGYEGCVNEVATSPPLPSLAIVHPKLPWPIVIQRSGDQEWVMVADVVETLWHVLQMSDPMRLSSPSTSSLLNYQKDVTFNSYRSMSGGVEREMVPRLVYLKGRTRFMGLSAIGSDTWELLVA